MNFDLNTYHVKVQSGTHISMPSNAVNLNTYHVKVQYSAAKELSKSDVFKYISC